MSSISFLNANDFGVKDGELVCSLSSRGMTVILFYSSNCQFCPTAIDQFKQLPGLFQGCRFCMVNITNNYSIIEMSKQTKFVIQVVPLVMVYFNGVAKAIYNGRIQTQTLGEYLVKAHQQLSNPTSGTTAGKTIPPYTVGIPVCDGDVCYIDYSKAYNKEEKEAPQQIQVPTPNAMPTQAQQYTNYPQPSNYPPQGRPQQPYPPQGQNYGQRPQGQNYGQPQQYPQAQQQAYPQAHYY